MWMRVIPIVCCVWFAATSMAPAQEQQPPPQTPPVAPMLPIEAPAGEATQQLVPVDGGVPGDTMGEDGDETDLKLREAVSSCQGDGGLMPTGGIGADLENPEETTLQFLSYVQKFTFRSSCSQMMAAWALELKNEALALDETNRALAAGAADKDAVEKSKQKVSEVSAAVDAGLKDDSRELKKASRGPLLAAILYTAVTVKASVDYAKAAKDYVGFTGNVLKNAGMFQKARMALSLRSSIGFAKDTPGAIASTLGSLRALVGYARARGVEVPADALSVIEGK
jgi:hypothetical protein